MHSHDRTLLARLGFSDPDKTNPEHDHACRYLSLPENHEALFQVAEVPTKGETKAECEVAIGKGMGQYRTTIGFVDVTLLALHQGRLRSFGSFDFGANSTTVVEQEYMGAVIGIEVKVAPVSWADALRQINLYREYLPSLRWILAVRYDVTEEYVAALKNEGVIVIRLGKKFEEWITQDKKIVAPLKEI